MRYRKFGNTGIQMSALGFGCMRLPMHERGSKRYIDMEESYRMLRKAYDGGVNYFDTAPGYCDTQSEIAVGAALKEIRDKVYIATKNPIENASGADWMKRLEKSLKQLNTDYIDFYHMWGIGWDAYTQKIDVKDGPMEMARKAKEQGLIRHISFSFHDAPENMIKLVDTGNFESVLCQYSLLDRSNEAAIAHAAEKGLGVVIMGPVAGGRLGAPSPFIQNLIPGGSKSSAEIALRFVLSNPNVSVALSGMSEMFMVDENVEIASRDSTLTRQEQESVLALMDEKSKLADLYCTGCNYCMPCPYGVNIPRNFELMNYHRLYNLTDYARGEYAKIAQRNDPNSKTADECTQCGVCEDKCPQKIKIREQLQDTAQALGV